MKLNTLSSIQNRKFTLQVLRQRRAFDGVESKEDSRQLSKAWHIYRGFHRILSNRYLVFSRARVISSPEMDIPVMHLPRFLPRQLHREDNLPLQHTVDRQNVVRVNVLAPAVLPLANLRPMVDTVNK